MSKKIYPTYNLTMTMTCLKAHLFPCLDDDELEGAFIALETGPDELALPLVRSFLPRLSDVDVASAVVPVVASKAVDYARLRAAKHIVHVRCMPQFGPSADVHGSVEVLKRDGRWARERRPVRHRFVFRGKEAYLVA